MSIKLNHADANDISTSCDLILTDPPFELSGKELVQVFRKVACSHLVLICSMHQLIEFLSESKYQDNKHWQLAFDFVIDFRAPKKSKNIRQPHYTHATGAYLTRKGSKSRFNRKLRERSDAFDNNGYWSTVIHAPRERAGEHGMAKNQTAITDILGSFDDTKTVYDPFAGSGTTGLAAYELGLDCELTERDADYFELLQKTFRFLS